MLILDRYMYYFSVNFTQEQICRKYGSESEFERLSPAQKIIVLKYARTNNNFIFNPENYPKILIQLSTELSKLSKFIPVPNLLLLVKDWVNDVSNKKQLSTCEFEDKELLGLIDMNYADTLSQTELSCILDHLEIATNAPQVWTTISLELEALGSTNFDPTYCEMTFESWNKKIKRKKEILDEVKLTEIERANFFNDLEKRLLQLVGNNDITRIKNDEDCIAICRVCLSETGENLRYIHENNFLCSTIAERICECSCIDKITKDDGYPQFICGTCLELLENAHKFKKLCEQSANQLRDQMKEPFKEEYIEYVFEEEDIQDQFTGTDPSEKVQNISDDDTNVTETVSSELNPTDIFINNNDQDRLNISTICTETAVHQCETCGIICYNEGSLKKHTRTHLIKRPYHCEICQKDFKTKLSLKIHMRSHTGERPYVCEVCGKAFTQDSSLIYHRSIHSGEKKYMCDLCDYRARNINDLKIHIRKHTGIRPYHCTQCSSSFTTSSNLKKHLRRHTGDKNVQTCGKAFKTWSAVSNHRVIHSELKQFTCPHCPYKGSTKANLKIHSRTHTGVQPYACNVCPLKFSTASNRKKHIKNVHQKVKSHECGSCGRSFFSRESARKHMVIHTGLKPYTCTECHMAYGWYNGLQKHMKTQHQGVKMPTEKHFVDLMEK